MLFRRPFVFPNFTAMEILVRVVVTQRQLLYVLGMHTISGARVFVAHFTANENRRCQWKCRQNTLNRRGDHLELN